MVIKAQSGLQRYRVAKTALKDAKHHEDAWNNQRCSNKLSLFESLVIPRIIGIIRCTLEMSFPAFVEFD